MGNIPYSDYSIDSRCPTGYANDDWLTFTKHNYGNCTVPIEFVYYFSHIFTTVTGVILLFLLHSVYIHIKTGKKSIAYFTFWGFVSGIFLIVWVQSLAKRVVWSYFAMGMFFSTFMVSIIYTTKHIITAIPDSLLNHINKERNFLTKDRVIRFLFLTCVMALTCYSVLTVILLPIFYQNENVSIALFQASCGFMSVLVVTTTTIGYRSTMIMVNLIDSILNDNTLQLSSNSESTQSMKSVRNRIYGVTRLSLVSGYFPMIMWILHTVYIPMYWYLAMIHMIGGLSLYFSILAMYYVETLKTSFKNVSPDGQKEKSGGTIVKVINSSTTNDIKPHDSSVIIPSTLPENPV